MNDKLFIVVSYGRSADVTENFTEATLYSNYEEAKKRYESEVKRIKTMELTNKKEYEYEDEDSYEVSDDYSNVDGVYVKEVEINKTFPV